MVDAIQVSDVDFKAFVHGRIGVESILAVRDGLVAIEERRPFARKTQHGVIGVVNRTVDVQVNEVDVPVVLVAAVGGKRRIHNTGVVVEPEIEVVAEVSRVFDGNHHLLEILSVVLNHEGVESHPGHTPDVVPSGVGHGGEDRVAGHGNATLILRSQCVGDDGEKTFLAAY